MGALLQVSQKAALCPTVGLQHCEALPFPPRRSLGYFTRDFATQKIKDPLTDFPGQGCFIDVITSEGTIPMISPETPQGLQGELCPLLDTEGAVWVFKFQFISTTSHVSVMKLK